MLRHECPHCGCDLIRNRGALKYANSVQCFRCCEWYTADALALQGGRSKSLAQRRADAPLRPAVEQRPIEHGLFGDLQLDLADRTDLKP